MKVISGILFSIISGILFSIITAFGIVALSTGLSAIISFVL